MVNEAFSTSITEIIATMQQQFQHMKAKTRLEPMVSWEIRLHRLQRLEKMLEENQEAIITAISQDFGHRAMAETTMLELFPSLSAIRHYQRAGKHWMTTSKVRTGTWFLPAKSYIKPQPLGLVGIIAPWNYPLYLVIEPLAGALVAGNRAMIKVSEAVPHFETWLAKTMPKYFQEDEVYVVTGDIGVAKAFSHLAFDHLFFTGSTPVGKQIMQTASQNLTPVTLELGGKSPVILTPDTDINTAVKHIWLGKSFNAGQTCIAPDYVIMPKGVEEKFIQASQQWFEQHYPNLVTNTDYSYIINDKQFHRLQTYLTDAQEKQSNVIPLTPIEPNASTNLFPPYIITNIAADAKVVNEEIFGPILPIVTYDSLDSAIAYVNQRDRPLALYVFGNNKAHIKQVLEQTVSGGACINETIFHIAQPNLPFGGIGASGMGKYHGKYSFDTFSHHKAILQQSPINFIHLLSPPYGKRFWNMMKFMK